MIQQAIRHNPRKKIFLIGMFPSICRNTLLTEGNGDPQEASFMKINHELAAKYSEEENFFPIEGKDVLDDYNYLATDFLHPYYYGHAVMGMNLARLMKPHL